jgi:hypothetical protein
MAFPLNLRYSPVNSLIVSWGFNGEGFDLCGLPEHRACEEEEEEGPAFCRPLPIQEAIDTYDWARWLPEVIVGIEDPDEDIAANYVRQAAIEFAKGSRVLQREVVIELQRNVDTYPVFPYEGEQIIGAIAARIDNGVTQECSTGCCGGRVESVDWVLDVARNQITVNGDSRCGLLRVLVYSAPTEDACFHDRFLYDHFRADITIGARLTYANAVHFRDRALMASLPTAESFTRAIVLAKRKVMRTPSSHKQQPGSGMWGGGGARVRDDQYYLRGR